MVEQPWHARISVIDPVLQHIMRHDEDSFSADHRSGVKFRLLSFVRGLFLASISPTTNSQKGVLSLTFKPANDNPVRLNKINK